MRVGVVLASTVLGMAPASVGAGGNAGVSLRLELRPGPPIGERPPFPVGPTPAVFRQGRPIDVDLIVTNEGDHDVELSESFGGFVSRPDEYRLIVYDHEGVQQPAAPALGPRPTCFLGATYPVSPGTSHSTRASLNRFVMPLAPGKYNVIGRWSQVKGAGTLQSPSVEFEIGPVTQTEMGEYIERLRKALRASGGQRREQVWRHIGFTGDPCVIPDVVEALCRGDEGLRGALEALLHMRDQAACVDALLKDAEVNGPSFWGMWVLSAHYHAPKERLLPLVLSALSDPDREQREWAAGELDGHEEFGREVLQALVRAVQDPEPKVRRAAVRSLWLWGRPEVVEALLYAIEDPDPHVRTEAATGLGICDAVEAVPRLRWLLTREWSVAEPAIEALEFMKPPEAFDALSSALGSQNERVRLRAATALLVRGDDSVRPLLADGLEKANAEVAALIHDALDQAVMLGRIPGPGEQGVARTSQSEAWIEWLREAR